MALSAAQLKQRLSELLELPKKEADNILWALETICEEVVQSGESLTLPGIGKLDCKVQAARKARNPRTGESVNVPAKVAVKFRVAKSLKDNAPSLTSKKGKRLLEEVEAKNKAKAKRKRQAEADTSTKKAKKSKGVKRAKATSGRKARY
jgi:DNA-binding protein HU-beta